MLCKAKHEHNSHVVFHPREDFLPENAAKFNFIGLKPPDFAHTWYNKFSTKF